MRERSIEHASFSIERRYDVPPATVFAAWADAAAKARWFSESGEWVAGPLELDFRVGGSEVQWSGPEGGPVHTYRAMSSEPRTRSESSITSPIATAHAGLGSPDAADRRALQSRATPGATRAI